jgi:hypothetical protein
MSAGLTRYRAAAEALKRRAGGAQFRLRNSERPMQIETLYRRWRSALIHFSAAALLLSLAARSALSATQNPAPDKNASRAQLSIGYSMLYREANGIPKLKWLLMFKDKPEEMGRLTNELIGYYQQLADTMQRLSKEYPGMRIDVAPMSEIEGA